jgi:trehalose utilization protein
MTAHLRLTVWNEYRHEVANKAVGEIYPRGIHSVVAGALRDRGFAVRTKRSAMTWWSE